MYLKILKKLKMNLNGYCCVNKIKKANFNSEMSPAKESFFSSFTDNS